MSTNGKKILRIDALKNTVAGVLEIDGAEHNVLQPTLRAQQVVLALQESATSENLAELLKAVRQVVPSLSDEQFESLNTDQALAIMTLAGGNIEAVEKAFPNAVGPESNSTSPG